MDSSSGTAPAATVSQQASVAGTHAATGTVPPVGHVGVLNAQPGSQVNSCSLCLQKTHLVIDCLIINSQLTGGVKVIERSEAVRVLVLPTIQVSAWILFL